jgi:holliday junction resolvase YEN1
LAELPLLPLFVFDGRNRPKLKRGSRKGKSGSHGLTDGMKKLLDVFGMEWRMVSDFSGIFLSVADKRKAEGEAEAELAQLNLAGVIDAVMTDDVDALVFGARTIIRK